MRDFIQNDRRLGLLLGLAVFIVYLGTVSPSIGFEDWGELAACLSTLGVVHPTGYPLFTLTGWAFVHLPFGANPMWKLNLFGAVLSSLATVLFFRLFLFLLSEKAALLFGLRADSEADPKKAAFRNNVLAASVTLTLAFSRTYWSEAVSLEVYAAHLVFLPLVTWLFLRALAEHAARPGRHADRLWMWFALALGFSFTNHMMTVLLAPAFLYLFFAVQGWGRPAWIRIARAVPPFAAPLLLYLYLPLRAAQGPVMNWNHPDSPEAFWRHIRAAQYSQQMFSSWEVAIGKLIQFAADFPPEFGYGPLAVAALGLWLLVRRGKRLAAFTALIFAGCLIYGVNYAFDDPNFYLNAYLATAAWILFGLLWLWSRPRNGVGAPARALCAALFLFPLLLNYRILDKSRDYAIEDYARNVLGSLDSGAVLFSNEYALLGSPAYYLQLVEGFRRDVVVLDIVLFGNPWYYAQLEQRYPWLVDGSRPEMEAYRAEIAKFLRGEADTLAHDIRLSEMFLSIIGKSRGTRPVYITSGINVEAAPGYQRVPSGMVFRLWREDEPVTVPPPLDFVIRPLPSPEANRQVAQIRKEYGEGYALQGYYRGLLGDTAGAAALLRKALEIQPDYPEAAAWLGQLGYFR